MAKIGITRKTKEQQRRDAELEAIIEDFGNAMRLANRQFIARPRECWHGKGISFTPHMEVAWMNYVDFCARNPS
jgi:hypothetical protein